MPEHFSIILMQSDVALRPDQLRRVQAILRSHIPDREVRAFGSRVTGAHKQTSDLDLCIMGARRLLPSVLERLRLAFSDSTLPIRVDIVEWAALSPTFRSIVAAHSAAIQSPL